MFVIVPSPMCFQFPALRSRRPSVALMIDSLPFPFSFLLFGASSELVGALAQFCSFMFSLFSWAWTPRGCCSQRPWRVCFPSLRPQDVPTEVTEFPYIYSTLVFINLQQFLISSPPYIILLSQPQNVFQALLFSHYLSVCLSSSPIPADKTVASQCGVCLKLVLGELELNTVSREE